MKPGLSIHFICCLILLVNYSMANNNNQQSTINNNRQLINENKDHPADKGVSGMGQLSPDEAGAVCKHPDGPGRQRTPLHRAPRGFI
jgi:hypothetical protein